MERRKNLFEENDFTASKVSDWVKKTFMTGVGAVFMTEEGIRNALSDMKMPKTVIAAAVAQAEKTKKEISGMIAKEVRSFLDRIKIEDIIQKSLAGQAIEIRATIKFSDQKDHAKRKGKKMTAKDDDQTDDDDL
jgi:hypothetical protein